MRHRLSEIVLLFLCRFHQQNWYFLLMKLIGDRKKEVSLPCTRGASNKHMLFYFSEGNSLFFSHLVFSQQQRCLFGWVYAFLRWKKCIAVPSNPVSLCNSFQTRKSADLFCQKQGYNCTASWHNPQSRLFCYFPYRFCFYANLRNAVCQLILKQFSTFRLFAENCNGSLIPCICLKQLFIKLRIRISILFRHMFQHGRCPHIQLRQFTDQHSISVSFLHPAKRIIQTSAALCIRNNFPHYKRTSPILSRDCMIRFCCVAHQQCFCIYFQKLICRAKAAAGLF